MWKNQSALPYFYAFDRFSQFKFESRNLQFGGSGSFVFNPRLRVLFENRRCKNVGVKTLMSGDKTFNKGNAFPNKTKSYAAKLEVLYQLASEPTQRRRAFRLARQYHPLLNYNQAHQENTLWKQTKITFVMKLMSAAVPPSGANLFVRVRKIPKRVRPYVICRRRPALSPLYRNIGPLFFTKCPAIVTGFRITVPPAAPPSCSWIWTFTLKKKVRIYF